MSHRHLVGLVLLMLGVLTYAVVVVDRPLPGRKRAAAAADESRWYVSLACTLNAVQLDALAEQLPYAMVGCGVDRTGQGTRTALLRLVCQLPDTVATATALSNAIVQSVPNPACTTGPLFGVEREKQTGVHATLSTFHTAHTARVLTQSSDGVTTQSPAPWHLDRIDQQVGRDQTYRYARTGTGVVAYHLDTGARLSSSEFGGRASLILDLVEPNYNGDCNGHGTYTLSLLGGLVSGVAKNVTMHVMRVLGCAGTGYMSDIVLAITDIIDRQLANLHAAVVSMSLSGPADSVLDAYVNALVNTYNVAVAVASGNQGTYTAYYSPGRASAPLTVGASTIWDTLADFSNAGPGTDLTAPGYQIVGACSTADSCVVTGSGTSASTPMVAGALALVCEVQLPAINGSAAQATLMAMATAPGSIRIDTVGDPFAALPLLNAGVDLPVPPSPSPTPAVPSPTVTPKVPSPPAVATPLAQAPWWVDTQPPPPGGISARGSGQSLTTALAHVWAALLLPWVLV